MVDWGTIAQIGATVLPSLIGGGKGGTSAPASSGGYDWGTILSVLGSQAAKLRAVPNAGASDEDVKKANRITLLATLLGGGAAALGTGMTQARQGAAYGDALKILGGMGTTTGQPIAPSDATGAVGGTKRTLLIPVIGPDGKPIYDEDEARALLARQGYQDIEPGGALTPMTPSASASQVQTAATPGGIDYSALGPLLGAMSPEQSKAVMGQVQQQQKLLERATRPFGLNEISQAMSAAGQMTQDPELKSQIVSTLLTGEQERRIGALPASQQARARQMASQTSSPITGLFGSTEGAQVPAPAVASPALRGLMGPSEQPEATTEIARRQEPVQAITPEMGKSLSLDEMETLEDVGAPLAAATPTPTPQARPFLAGPSRGIEIVQAEISEIQNARTRAEAIMADRSRSTSERVGAGNAVDRANVLLKERRDELKSLKAQENVERRLSLQEQANIVAQQRGEEQGERAEAAQRIGIIKTADANAKEAFNGYKLPETTKALTTGAQLLEGGRFSQTRAAEAFKRSIDGTGVIGGELVQMLNDIRPELAQRVDSLFSKYAGMRPSDFTDAELADLRRGFAVSTMVAYQQVNDIRNGYRENFRRYGKDYTGEVPDPPYEAESAKLAAAYDRLIQKIPAKQRQGLPVSIRGLTSEQINDSYDGIALAPTQTQRTGVSDLVGSLFGMSRPTPTPTASPAPIRYQPGMMRGNFEIVG